MVRDHSLRYVKGGSAAAALKPEIPRGISRISPQPGKHRRNRMGNTCNKEGNGEKLPIDTV
jgi:hypothetical protein